MLKRLITLALASFVTLGLLAIPASAEPRAKKVPRVIVLVSGVAATTPYTTPTNACKTGYSAGNTWAYLRDYLTERGYKVYTAPASVGGVKVVETADTYAGPFGDCPRQLPARMTINNIGPVDRSASSLARFIRYLHNRHGVQSVDVVGHSLGGLIGRAGIREVRLNGIPVRVNSYTTLGSPWDGAMLAAPTNPTKPLTACDGLKVCEQFLESLLPVPGIDMLVANLNPKNMQVWNQAQIGALDGIPVTLIGGSYFTKPGGNRDKWPNDGAIQLRSALGASTSNAVLPHRRCHTLPLTHSIFVSTDVNAPLDTALTWNPQVGQIITGAIDGAGKALKTKNRVGCPGK